LVVPHGTRLSWPERLQLAAEIMTAYALVRWRLSRLPFAAAVAALRATSRPTAKVSQEAAFRLGQTVQRTLRVLPFDSKCLVRSLVLMRMLTRRGVDCTLVIGARTKPEFAAHAWVERDGVPLLPTSIEFERLTEM
jgi:hypothetical protein